MKTPAALFPIVLALGALILAPVPRACGQDAQEGPIEIEKCRTIDKPGSYKLVNNLTFTGPPGICLNITTSSVTIDLAGFTITAQVLLPAGAGAIAAVAPNEVSNIAVRNGSISGFGGGVDLGANSIVEELRISGTPSSSLGISAAGIVRGNTVAGVGNAPASTAVGIRGTGVVTGNFVEGNGTGMGIGQGSTVIGNTVIDNRTLGISVDCPSNVTNNTAVNTSEGPNLVLNGNGCNNTNNVAP